MIVSPSSSPLSRTPNPVPPLDLSLSSGPAVPSSSPQAPESRLFAATPLPKPPCAHVDSRPQAPFLAPCTPEQLKDLAVASDIFDLRAFLGKNKININAQNEQGETALMLAAREGHLEACTRLCALGAHRAATDRNGNTPLIQAVRGGHVAIVKVLLQDARQAALESKNQRDETALLLAARDGTVEMCQLLRDAGAGTNGDSWDYAYYLEIKMALQSCIQSGHNEKSLVLLEVISEYKPREKSAWERFQRSVFSSSYSDELEDEDGLPKSLLEFAVKYAGVRVCKALLKNSVPTGHGRQKCLDKAWLFAVQRKCVRGASAEERALFEQSSEEICQLLLNAGAKVQFQAKVGRQSDWHTALGNADRGVFRALLAAGADIEAKDTYGRSPLVIAAHCGHRELFILLWMHGADAASVPAFLESHSEKDGSQVRTFLKEAGPEVQRVCSGHLMDAMGDVLNKDVNSIVASYNIPGPVPAP